MDKDTLTALFGPLPPDVVPDLQAMLQIYSISAEELFYKWESYCMKMGPETRPTPDSVAAFRKDVMAQLEKEVRARARTVQTPARRKVVVAPGSSSAAAAAAASSAADWMMMDELAPSVKRKLDRAHNHPPAKASRGPGGGASVKDSVFANRAHRGEIVEVLNPQIERPVMPRVGGGGWEERVRLEANIELKKFGFRTMHQKLSEASEVMDDRIDVMMAAVQEHYGFADEEFGNPSTASPGEIIAVGRIASDSLGGRLNDRSVLLEASRRMGAGARVPLKLDAVKSFSFFPGQIVAVRGINASGQYLAVSQVLDAPLLPLPVTAPETLRESAERLKDGPLSVFVASGPYTTDDNLLFEALDEICERAAQERPDVVLLTGPFVDSEHPMVRTGDFEVELEARGPLVDLFRERVSPKIRKIEHSMVILVPAITDAINPHVAYPQDALKRRGIDLPSKQNIRLLPNPAIFSINGVVFATSTPDILLHLSSTECRRNPAEANPTARLSRALMEQRNLYPLFPPARGVNLDVPYMRLADLGGARPDVVVLPSTLAATAKVVAGVVVVNPGHASRRRAAGGWCRMWIAPKGEGEAEAGVFAGVRAEVVRV